MSATTDCVDCSGCWACKYSVAPVKSFNYNLYLYDFVAVELRILIRVSGRQFFEDIHPFYQLTKDGVLDIKSVLRCISNEKLTAVRIGSLISH